MGLCCGGSEIRFKADSGPASQHRESKSRRPDKANVNRCLTVEVCIFDRAMTAIAIQRSSLRNWSHVFRCQDDVIEPNAVHAGRVLCAVLPCCIIGDVVQQPKEIDLKAVAGAPTKTFEQFAAAFNEIEAHACPRSHADAWGNVRLKFAVKPRRQLAIRFVGNRIEFDHHFNALPCVGRNLLRLDRTDAVAPKAIVRRDLHFGRIWVEVQGSRRLEPATVARRFIDRIALVSPLQRKPKGRIPSNAAAKDLFDAVDPLLCRQSVRTELLGLLLLLAMEQGTVAAEPARQRRVDEVARIGCAHLE